MRILTLLSVLALVLQSTRIKGTDYKHLLQKAHTYAMQAGGRGFPKSKPETWFRHSLKLCRLVASLDLRLLVLADATTAGAAVLQLPRRLPLLPPILVSISI